MNLTIFESEVPEGKKNTFRGEKSKNYIIFVVKMKKKKLYVCDEFIQVFICYF